MNLKKVWAAAPLLVAFTSLPASAVEFTFSDEFSGSGGTCANGSCATLEVLQSGANVTFTLTSTLAAGEFITGFYGNQDPYALGTDNLGGTSQIISINGTTDATATPDTGLNAFQADGDGQFDYVIDISTAAADRLDDGETLTWTITNTSLASVTTFLSNPAGGSGPFLFALRVQGLATGSGSGWFSPDGEEPPQENPEPGSLLLLGLGLAGLALMQRRRRRV